MDRRFSPLAAVLLFASALAGCASDAPAADVDDTNPQAPPPPAVAVVALVDTGINPYHVDFRDNSSLAHVHPSTYLPGFPEDAIAVTLSLEDNDLEAAREKDKDVWGSLKPGTLYWFPGTKVMGISFDDGGNVIFSTGHGSMVASRAAGNNHSLCPDCRIVSVQGFNGKAVTWASQQPWIDAQSNSWSPAVVFQQAEAAPMVGEPGLAEAFATAAKRHAVFASAGNGAMGKLGVLGHPSFTRSTSGPPGVVSVGGHDNGQVILWSGSWPHVVADACDNWAVVGDSIHDYGPREGGGTSSASPYAAGEAARLVLEARKLLGAPNGRAGDGVLARGEPPANLTGPLADGDLTLDELKDLLFKTAVARPAKTPHDGEPCPPTSAPYSTYPIPWSDIPEDVPTYALLGYGQVSVASLEAALGVLRGEAELPARPLEDEWHQRANALRDAYNGLPP